MAMAVAAVMTSSFMGDSLDAIVDSAFYQSNRQHAMLLFTDDVPISTLDEVARLPAVRQVEGQQYHGAVLRNRHFEKRVSIEARLPGMDLSRVVDADGAVLDIPPGGIVLSNRLAGQLQVSAW
jgi:putative ABC transport system permease protein